MQVGGNVCQPCIIYIGKVYMSTFASGLYIYMYIYIYIVTFACILSSVPHSYNIDWCRTYPLAQPNTDVA